ncbi:MAG: L-aspartate oxidase [Rhodanobacteraceae bacterium]|nr:L-aspartate oxidase [Rhodanobacteraceae bacterium]
MHFDLIVVGSGIAGLSTALAAAPRRVALITRGELARDGASRWAQGGIAAALGPGDSPAVHASDTLAAGNGLNDAAAVEVLTRGAAEAVEWLSANGAAFDRNAQGFLLGREAAHSQHRIVHANGDATGAAVMQALAVTGRTAAHLQIFEQHAVVALRRAGERICGVVAQGAQDFVELDAAAVVLATGGIGALYRHTTNPEAADASGLALALEAGAALSDMEFVQFHPTALRTRDGRSGQLPLLTEALRGAGAVLLNGAGKRFMRLHAREAELAPRDVVARGVWAELERGETVWLDASTAVGADFPQRFPTVFAACMAEGLDPRREAIPVVPAQHYHMGGVRVDAAAQSSVPGLYAVGEVACSGVHGANRLASNSLLEGLVFGRALGRRLAAQLPPAATVAATVATAPPADDCAQVSAAISQAVRDLLWREVGLVRDASGLRQALAALDTLARSAGTLAERRRIAVAVQITAAALHRHNSVGAHYRRDAVQARAG